MSAALDRAGFAYRGSPRHAKPDDLVVWFDGSVIGVVSDPAEPEPGVISLIGLVDDEELPSMLLAPATSTVLIIREAAGISARFDADEIECLVRTCAELWASAGDPHDDLSERQREMAQRALTALSAELEGDDAGDGQ